MEPRNKTILLIENQFNQFEKILKKLEKDGYTVVPSVAGYEEFTNWIRVLVDGRYSPDRIRKCIAKIEEYLGSTVIDLLIIDYKLAGNFDGLTGIGLWQKFQAMKDLKGHPCIFLSRTPANEEDVKNNMRLVENAVWIEKGYAGMHILDDSYFKPHVLDVIPVLIETSITEVVRNRIDELIKTDLFKDKDCLPKIKSLRNKPRFTNDEIDLVHEFKEVEKMSPTEIKNLVTKKYKHIW
jgi:hypothetical protein